jgi:hypothetical protein
MYLATVEGHNVLNASYRSLLRPVYAGIVLQHECPRHKCPRARWYVGRLDVVCIISVEIANMLCGILRTPVALLANYRKVSIMNFQGAGSQDITVMPIAYKGAAQTMELSSSAV